METAAMLARFCIDVAKVTTRAGLAAIAGGALRGLGIDTHLVCLVTDDKATYSYLASGTTPALNRHAPPADPAHRFAVAGSLAEAVLGSAGPVAFSRSKVLKHSQTSDLPLKTLGRDGLLGIQFGIGLRNTGILWVKPGVADLLLLQAVSSQIGIVLAYIIASEEIESQASQIQFLKNKPAESRLLPAKEETSDYEPGIIGTGEAMEKVLHLIDQVSRTQSTVLLLGETGTGKELIAKAIHRASLRKDRVMVTVNCAALPPSLIESELFGHEKGSFTGAAEQRIGKWELAHKGTLFLDEIGDMPTELQVKLLRALQEKEIERIGGSTVIQTDVRVIAATSKDLSREAKQGTFRSDLFFRLNIFPITIPALRERREDIPALALHFLDKYARKSGRKVTGISSRVIKKLCAYNWPGNVRELENLIERSVLLTSRPVINQLHLPAEEQNMAFTMEYTRPKTMDEVAREHIMRTLRSCKGKVAGPGGAAEVLGMPPTTLHSMMKRLGIRKQYSG